MLALLDTAQARKLAAALMLALAAHMPLQAQEDAGEVFAASGLESVFAKGPETVVEIAHELGADPDTTALWTASAQLAFDRDRLTAQFRTVFLDELDPEAIPGIIEFRTSTLGQAITAAEVDINTLTGKAYATRKAAAEKAAESLPEERHALYDRLAELTASLNVETHFVSPVEALLAPLLPAEQVETLLDEVRATLAAEPEHIANKRTVIVIYEEFSDTELEAYIAHLESPDGHAFQQAMVLAQDPVFVEAADILAEDFAERIARR